MSQDARKDVSRAMTKDERLAAKLRENLRRRKAQSRAKAGVGSGESGDNGLSKPDEQG